MLRGQGKSHRFYRGKANVIYQATTLATKLQSDESA